MKTQQQMESDLLFRMSFNKSDFNKVKRYANQTQRIQIWSTIK